MFSDSPFMIRPHLIPWASRLTVAAAVMVPLSATGGHALQGVLEQIVVSVNGDIISKTEIDERLRVTRALTDDAAGAVIEPALLTRILRDAVDERLMIQRAAELGLDVGDVDVDRVLATVKAESHVDSEAAFIELLEREGMSLVTLRGTTRRRLLIEQVRQHLFGRLSVTHEEALRYYNAHRLEFMTRATVTFREVRISVPPRGRVPDSERDRGLVKVVRVGDRLAEGAEFETVARAFSESPSKAAGGLVGPVESGGLEPSIRAALGALHPGAMSAPVETSEGYCFLKLEASEAASAPTFHEARERVVGPLLAMKQRSALEGLLGRLRASAILQWKRPDLKAAYERPSPYR
jgi:peptidyl-prolyl cis-trans isomerase SurA